METLAAFIVFAAFVVAFFGSIFGLAQVLSPDRIRRLGQNIWPLRLTLWQMMSGVAVAAFLILAFEKGYETALVLVVVSLFVLAWFVRAWSHEFVFLMGLRDIDLPARHDKLIWAFLLLIFPPITTWLFRSFRLAHWPEPVQETQAPLRSETKGTTATQPA
ncbi:MAG TPA: hypothetical protein VHS97_00775 [Isosphaeraceae bacterium]|jgi:hypothetical protein|nr:hypothetical protein [Isosphaeraceae bacterium]